MSSVRQRDTKPEMLLRRALHARGLRYRLHDHRLPGSPDLVFPRFTAVVFVHGCFWHAHVGCKFATVPSTRPEFWRNKLEANRSRDERAQVALREQGWRVLIVWQCSLKGRAMAGDECALLVEAWLRSDSGYAEIGPPGNADSTRQGR